MRYAATGSVDTTHSAAPLVVSAFRGWIDAPADGRSPSSHFVVRGWCYHRQGASIAAVRIRIGARTFPGVYGDRRPDVYQAFPEEPSSEQSGYEIPVTLVAASPTGELQAQLADGSWHVVQLLALDALGHGVWRDRTRWAGFWWKAWRGQPDAWANLEEDERDFAVARERLRGCFNMFVGQQHAPRPVVRERFPAGRLPVEQLPRITIVTPSLQQGPFLEQTLRSVFDQRDVAIDYIVQDGGSTDNSVRLLRRYAARLAHWESVEDGGQADAIVRGFSHTGGRPDDLMMYLNSDDILMAGAGRFVAEYFAQHPETDVVYGHRVLIDQDGHEIGRWLTPRPACSDLRLHDFVPQETLFWRRRIWDRVGGIDPSFKFALDWDLLLRMSAAGARIVRLPWFLGGFRLHSRQKTSTQLQDTGIPEMDALRRRTFGRMPTHDELHLAMRRAQLDSALVYALLQRGWRV
jgi:GT2 family glycosyltransferase